MKKFTDKGIRNAFDLVLENVEDSEVREIMGHLDQIRSLIVEKSMDLDIEEEEDGIDNRFKKEKCDRAQEIVEIIEGSFLSKLNIF